MRVYLDDERPTPDGWVGVRWPDEAIELLRKGEVVELSLDHDLGDDTRGTGYDVITWIERAVAEEGFRPPRIKVHSANPAARLRMEAGIASIARLPASSARVSARRPTVLALDLEGTLISSAMSQIPRPGLGSFLVKVRAAFRRVVIYTTVDEKKFHGIAQRLVQDREFEVPEWFAQLEYINWPRQGTKDLRAIPGLSAVDEALLLDDVQEYVHPEQFAQWVEIANYDPRDSHDAGLPSAWAEIERRIGRQQRTS